MQKTTKKFTSFFVMTSFFGALVFTVISACSNQAAKAKPNYVFKDATKDGVVAKIGGQDVTLDELIGDGKLQYLDLQKKIYEFKMERLKKVLEERLIGAEAKKANLSTAEFIEKKITKGKNNVSDKQLSAFVKEKKIPENQLNPQLKERIVEYLKTKAKDDMVDEYLAKLTKGSPVEVYFQKPKMQIAVEIGDAPLWGDKNAPVTIVEFSDFQCPFCSRANNTLNDVKKKYKGKVKVAFKHFPLSFHKQAEPAAIASLCVNEQSVDKFWKYHDTLFANQKNLEPADLEKYAKESGVDVKKWKECFDGKKFEKAVKDDLAYGEKLGVRSTPTFFVNGEIISGAVPLEDFSEVIEEALRTAKN